MKAKKWEKSICCMLAVILIILGMNGDVVSVDASFLYASNYMGATEASLLAVDAGIDTPAVCTLNMLRAGSQMLCNLAGGAGYRWQNKGYFALFFIAAYWLHRSIYQSEESKEDGQLFLCRLVTVDYIHQKDSGE